MASQESPKDLSVVIPIYNEQDTVAALAARLAEALEPTGWDFEVICVDDVSTDRSLERLLEEKAHRPWLRVRQLVQHGGQTCAMAAGFKAAQGRLIATLDGDLQNDPMEIPRMVALLDDCDAVTGWRVKRNDPWLRRVSTKVANAVRNWLSGESIHDSACSLKVYRRQCLENLMLFNGMHRFMPTLVKMQGFTVKEVPVSHHPRHAGQAKYGLWNRAWRAFVDLLAVRWMKKRYLRLDAREL